jgi:catechol 2,3-dioxygenase-like lactoylglutathione lyase family enzyme
LLSTGRVIPAIPVANLERSKDFYGRTLGLEPVLVDVPGSQLYRCGSGSYLVIYEGAGRPEQHVATFLIEAIDDEVAGLRARGVEFEEYDQPELQTVDGIASVGPIRGAWFKDPDDNVIGVVHLEATI